MTHKHEKYERLLSMCKSLQPARTAVAHPCDETVARARREAALRAVA